MQHCLNFLPLPQGQAPLRPTRWLSLTTVGETANPGSVSRSDRFKSFRSRMIFPKIRRPFCGSAIDSREA